MALVAGAACGSLGTDRGAAAPALVFLGEAIVAPRPEVPGDPQIGGLSSIFFVGDDRYLVASDDRGNHGPARYYTVVIDLADGRLDPDDATVAGWSPLSDRDGRPFAQGSHDFEGLVKVGEYLFVSSEGDAERGFAPFVGQFGADGSLIERLGLPPGWVPSVDAAIGVRNNLALESLAIAPGDRYLFTASENALLQDGPAASSTTGSPSRILRFDRQRGVFDAQFLYLVEPVHTSTPQEDLEVTGLVDLIAVSERYLLALERSFVAGASPQHSIKLFEVCIDDASDISDLSALAGAEAGEIVPVTKRFVADLADLVPRLDNVEGFSFGPELPNGSRSLIMVSDDNFAPDRQVTQFLAFEIPEGTLRGCE